MSTLQKFNSLKMSPLPDGKWVLEEDYKCLDITIPKGYYTNGADIPRIFWTIYPPHNPKYMPAIVLHDFLIDRCKYSKFNNSADRLKCFKEADKALYECLSKISTSHTTPIIYYAGVSFYTNIVRRSVLFLNTLKVFLRSG